MVRFNLGFALLKLWMCVEVVLTHFWNPRAHPIGGNPDGGLNRFFSEMRAYAVPCFMLMAFFLASERFSTVEPKWLKKRFARLLTPCIVWTLVTFAAFTALPAFSTVAKPTMKDLAYSILGTNVAIGAHMWFMAVLVILTGLFALFFRFVPRNFHEAGLWSLCLLAVILEYSGANYALFRSFHHDFQSPLGRCIPMIPYACLGLLAGRRRESWSSLSDCRRWCLSIAGVLMAAFFYNCDVFVASKGYYYTGLKMLTMAFALCTTAFFLPFERLPAKVRGVVGAVSCYTMGVYFVHILFGRPLEEFVFGRMGLIPQSFAGGLVVFAFCWFFCFLLGRIPNRMVESLVK